VGGADGRRDRRDQRRLVRRGQGRLVARGAVVQKVDDATPGKNRLHLDLSATDLDAEVDRLVEAGATLVGHRGDESFRWVTLADPHGNEFCVAQHGAAGAEF
jgi:predicted enzyme related to lactoylglutathione lyase